MIGFYYHNLVTTALNNISITLDDSLLSTALSPECWMLNPDWLHYSLFNSGHWTLLDSTGLTKNWLHLDVLLGSSLALLSLSLVTRPSWQLLTNCWIFTQSPEVGSRRTGERSPPFRVLFICLQSGCLGNSRFPAVTTETPTKVGFCGNALSEAYSSAFNIPAFRQHVTIYKNWVGTS
jgi:hypothetical protein